MVALSGPQAGDAEAPLSPAEPELPSAEEQPPLVQHPSLQSRCLHQRQPHAGVPLPSPSLPCTDSPKKHQNKLRIFTLLETPEEEPRYEPPWGGGGGGRSRAAHPGRLALIRTVRHGKACSFWEWEIRNDMNTHGCGGAWAALCDCIWWFLGVTRKKQDAHLH